MEWVPEIDYRGCSLTLLALEIEETEEKTGKAKTLMFQWLTDLVATLIKNCFCNLNKKIEKVAFKAENMTC